MRRSSSRWRGSSRSKRWRRRRSSSKRRRRRSSSSSRRRRRLWGRRGTFEAEVEIEGVVLTGNNAPAVPLLAAPGRHHELARSRSVSVREVPVAHALLLLLHLLLSSRGRGVGGFGGSVAPPGRVGSLLPDLAVPHRHLVGLLVGGLGSSGALGRRKGRRGEAHRHGAAARGSC